VIFSTLFMVLDANDVGKGSSFSEQTQSKTEKALGEYFQNNSK